MLGLRLQIDHHQGLSFLSVPSNNPDVKPVKFYGTQEWLEMVNRDLCLVGPTDAKVLITGETGTGKTTLARAIHLCHPKRATGPFRRTNLGALVPELAASQLFGHTKGAFTGAARDHTGIVEESDGGTFFMDEVSATAENVQVMLLTLLEERIIGSERESDKSLFSSGYLESDEFSLCGNHALGLQ